MSGLVDYDRRHPVPVNRLLEAHDRFDPTKEYFLAAHEEDDGGVFIGFVEDRGETCGLHVHHFISISAEDRKRFGEALLRAAATNG